MTPTPRRTVVEGTFASRQTDKPTKGGYNIFRGSIAAPRRGSFADTTRRPK